MKILLAILLPFLAIMLCGHPVLGLVMLVLQLTLIGWIPAMIVAIYVVSQCDADRRMDRLAESMANADRSGR